MLRHATAFLLFFLLSVSGCSRAPDNTLTVTMSLSEEEWRVMRQDIFPLFEERHGIKINGYQLDSAHLAAKLEAMRSAGRVTIDVFAQDNMSLAALVNKGLAEDLSVHRSKVPPAVLANLAEAGSFDGKLFFMPFRPNVQIAYINTEAFPAQPPRTWDELLAAAEKFHKKEGAGRILFKGFGGNPTATQVYEWILQAGGDPYAFNDAGCAAAFTFLQKLSPYLSSESKRAKWDTTNDALARRQAYWAQNWPFGVAVLVKDYGLNFISTYSGISGPAGEFHVIGGDVLGIPSGAPDPETALKFILFLQSRKVQEILVAKLGWPSIRSDAYTAVPEWQRPYFASVQEALARGVFRKNIAWWPVYSKYVNKAFRSIVFEGAPVAETLTGLKAAMEKEIP